MGTIIRWTNETWNPVTGCSKVSEGCRNCYAEHLMYTRFHRSPKPWTKPYAHLNVRTHPDRLRKPYSWRKPKMVFVNSMSDLFHEMVPDEFIAEVFAVMNDLPQHTFQILTKRPERAATWPGPWTDNIWMGTSVEDERVAHRIDTIRQCAAQTRFISFEPLIGAVESLNLSGIHWAIVGGESGPRYRPMELDWARDIRDACVDQCVAFFFKQHAGIRTEMDVELDGERWEQYPREHPRQTSFLLQTAV